MACGVWTEGLGGARRETRDLSGLVLHGPFDLALAFSVLDGVAFVMFGLAFGQRNFKLDFAIFPMHIQRHQGVALLLDFAHQALNFRFVQQQLFGSIGQGDNMRGRGAGWVDLTTDHKEFAFSDHDISIGELNTTVPHRFDLPTVQDHASLKALFNEVIEDGLFVVCNPCGGGGFGAHGI